jgi:DNA-binding MarR family transcriptional regulator
VPTRWLDENELRAWRAFLRMQGELAGRLNRQLQTDSGLSLTDYDVLAQLAATPDGRLRPFELQRRLHWEQSRLSHHLSRMLRRDLVSRAQCADDARGAYVVITDTGRKALKAAAPGHIAAVRQLFFDQLTPDQVTTLETLSTQVLKRLDADE